MFKITSYEPSPEAENFNQAVGLVEATKVEALPSTTTPKTTELTPEQKQAKVAHLAAIPEATLHTYKVAELRELAKGLFSNVNGYNKANLLAALIGIRNGELLRLETLAVAAKAATEVRQEKLFHESKTNTQERTDAIYKSLEQLVFNTQDESERVRKVSAFAAATVVRLQNLYAPTTIKGMLSEIGINLKARNTTSESLRQAIIVFVSTTWAVFSDVKNEIREQGKRDVEQRVSTECPVNGSDLLAVAKRTLEDVSEGKKTTWNEVAIALALTTGRRSAEILSSAIFKIEDGTLLFSGQLKAKGENRETRMQEFKQIPCLVDPALVLAGMEYLKAAKTVSGSNLRLEDPDKVNQTYAKALQRYVIKLEPIAGQKLMFKDLRAIYAGLCVKQFYKGTPRGVNAYLSEILGHREGDLTTAFSYLKFDVV